jgi:hypothetical protein
VIRSCFLSCSGFNAALPVFDKMSERNMFSWTVMIVGSTKNGQALFLRLMEAVGDMGVFQSNNLVAFEITWKIKIVDVS